MKNIKKNLKIAVVTLLIAAGLYAVASYFVMTYQSSVIEKLYAENDVRIDTEKEIRNKISGILKENIALSLEIEVLKGKYLREIEVLKRKVQEYKGKVFNDLPECQEKYNLLFANYEKCIFSHTQAAEIEAAQDEQILNLETALRLSEENYRSCMKRTENLEKIIIVKKRRSLWGKIKYCLFGAAGGVLLGVVLK